MYATNALSHPQFADNTEQGANEMILIFLSLSRDELVFTIEM
jgi:hypothetical protein